MDLYTLVSNLINKGGIRKLSQNPLAQFGTGTRNYLGATLLPERTVSENSFTEEQIRYRTIVANDGSRYSPAQLKQGGELIGQFEVTLGDSDIARQFTGRDYDAWINLLKGNQSKEALVQLLRWTDLSINRALIERNEIQRWQALINAQVTRVGDNGYRELVDYPNPTGHRVALATAWSDNTYDPWPDILSRAQLFYNKGYGVGRIVTSRKALSILANNAKIRARFTTTAGPQTAVTRAALNDLFSQEDLPSPETYDLRYETQTGSGRFLADNVMGFFATTGRDEAIQTTAGDKVVPETLGYLAVGRPVGQAEPGRVIILEPKNDKPPRVNAEGWQTSLPVITDPEGIAVITAII